MVTVVDLLKLILDAIVEFKLDLLIAIIAISLFLIGIPLFCIYMSVSEARTAMLMRCLPTSKARGVFIGLTEMKGTAELNPPLSSPLADKDCVWYKYKVEEHWRREKEETYRDSDGNTCTRTVTKTGWDTVDEGESTRSFLIRDDTGAIRVWPKGAEMESENFLSHSCDRSDPMYYAKGPEGSISDSTYERRFSEYGIRPDAPIYIIGTTREEKNGVHPEFAKAENNDPYLISVNKEGAIIRFNSVFSILILLPGFIVLLLPSVFADGFPDNIYNPAYSFANQSYWFHACWLYVVVWIIWSFWQWYGLMVAARNRVAQGVAQVEVQLQRRHDLIQQLVEVVEAFCRHEQGLMERVGELRRQVEEGQLALLAEAYPELKAQTLFAKLQQELSDTEERLALAREYRNEIGNYYNTRLRIFPTGLILLLLGFRSFRIPK